MSDGSSSQAPSRVASPVNFYQDHSSSRPFRFVWDPASRRPGPGSVSEATEGRGDYITTRPQNDFNTSSLKLNLAALPSEWSSSKHGFHAISTVLNSPHKRQAPPKAHSALPSVPPADLPRVRRKDFDAYLATIAPEWEKHLRSSEMGQESAVMTEDPATPRLSTSSVYPQPFKLPTGNRPLPPLRSVPPIFFKRDFNLADLSTFNDVTEQTPGSELDLSSVSYSLPLLEKFSHYADTVEQHLVSEISIRSASFFAALTNLHDLQSESEQCLARVSELRTLLSSVDDTSARRGLEITRRVCKARNLKTVQDAVRTIGGFTEMAGVARTLVNGGQWGEALSIIDEIEVLWVDSKGSKPPRTQERPPLPPTPRHQSFHKPPLASTAEASVVDVSLRHSFSIPLSSLQSFSSLPQHLHSLKSGITSSLSSELVEVLKRDVLERTRKATGQGSDDNPLKDRLRPLLHGLIRTNGLKGTLAVWREVAMVEIRGVMKQLLPAFTQEIESDEPNSPGQGTGLSSHLRNMEQQQFMDILKSLFLSFQNALKGLRAQADIIISIIESDQSPTSPAVEIASLKEELYEIQASAAEMSNNLIAKLVTSRAQQHAALEITGFVEFFNSVWDFVVVCEVMSQRMIVALRGVAVSQAKLFLRSFHQNHIGRSSKLVEDEQWSPVEITPRMQRLANALVDYAIRDPPDLMMNEDIDFLHSPQRSPRQNGKRPGSPHSPSTPSTKANGAVKNSKNLRIEDRTYYAVSATMEVLMLLLDYLQVIANLPVLTTDTMSRIIEFLKAYNSRTCQVVLGAGAMRSAGLRNITAKHLALASQSLSIMITLIPYVRETFRRHLSAKQAVMLVEFDTLKRDYQEHQNEIHMKLIAIMGDRLSVHVQSLKAVDWSVPKEGGGVNDYMEILVRETVTLHKVLSRYLATSIVEHVMTQVFAAINHRLSEEFSSIELPNVESKSRLLADARYLQQKLTGLKDITPPSAILATIVEEKVVRKQPPPPAAPSPVPEIPATAQAPKPTSSITSNGAQHPPPTRVLTANERIKGLFARSGTGTIDKALPEPTPPRGLSPAPGVSSNTTSWKEHGDSNDIAPDIAPETDLDPSPPVPVPIPSPLDASRVMSPLPDPPKDAEQEGSKDLEPSPVLQTNLDVVLSSGIDVQGGDAVSEGANGFTSEQQSYDNLTGELAKEAERATGVRSDFKHQTGVDVDR